MGWDDTVRHEHPQRRRGALTSDLRICNGILATRTACGCWRFRLGWQGASSRPLRREPERRPTRQTDTLTARVNPTRRVELYEAPTSEIPRGGPHDDLH